MHWHIHIFRLIYGASESKPEAWNYMQFWGNEQGDRWFACNSMQQYEKTDSHIYIYAMCSNLVSWTWTDSPDGLGNW
jgi:uncharacterized protein (DUF924 family)